MAINELNHINIRTVKMEETKDFFVDVVGLEIGFRPDFPSHGYWLYCGDVPIVHLSLSDPKAIPEQSTADVETVSIISACPPGTWKEPKRRWRNMGYLSEMSRRGWAVGAGVFP